MKKITAWKSHTVKESKDHPSYFIHVWEHNHIEDGWVMGLKPEPKFPCQKSWGGKKWKKQYCYIDENQVVTPAGV
jgi:hypothetical protein